MPIQYFGTKEYEEILKQRKEKKLGDPERIGFTKETKIKIAFKKEINFYN